MVFVDPRNEAQSIVSYLCNRLQATLDQDLYNPNSQSVCVYTAALDPKTRDAHMGYCSPKPKALVSWVVSGRDPFTLPLYIRLLDWRRISARMIIIHNLEFWTVGHCGSCVVLSTD